MTDESLREHVAKLLNGRGAHVDVVSVLDGLELAHLGQKSAGSPHTLWELFEHMRIAQWDILEFSRDPDHESPPFPAGYWPARSEPRDQREWQRSFQAFKSDLAAMVELVEDPETDLFREIPHGTGQTVLREALVVADHNAYHLGQIVLIMKALGLWTGGGLESLE